MQLGTELCAYDANDDFARSIELAYEVIRERVAKGGPTWRPRVTNTQGFTPAPFPQLQQPAAPVAAFEPPKKSKRRGPRPPKAAAGKTTKAKPAKKQRKPKMKPSSAPTAPRAADAPIQRKVRKPRALKVDLALAMSALSGLSEDDAKVVHSFVQALAPFSRKARERICGALVKVIG